MANSPLDDTMGVPAPRRGSGQAKIDELMTGHVTPAALDLTGDKTSVAPLSVNADTPTGADEWTSIPGALSERRLA